MLPGASKLSGGLLHANSSHDYKKHVSLKGLTQSDTHLHALWAFVVTMEGTFKHLSHAALHAHHPLLHFLAVRLLSTMAGRLPFQTVFLHTHA